MGRTNNNPRAGNKTGKQARAAAAANSNNSNVFFTQTAIPTFTFPHCFLLESQHTFLQK
jgi:cyclophilin family peptidyl-prolyl cis-trans isomerase